MSKRQTRLEVDLVVFVIARFSPWSLSRSKADVTETRSRSDRATDKSDALQPLESELETLNCLYLALQWLVGTNAAADLLWHLCPVGTDGWFAGLRTNGLTATYLHANRKTLVLRIAKCSFKQCYLWTQSLAFSHCDVTVNEVLTLHQAYSTAFMSDFFLVLFCGLYQSPAGRRFSILVTLIFY